MLGNESMEELAGVHLLILRVLGESIPYQLTHHLPSILVGGDGALLAPSLHWASQCQEVSPELII